jgi:hypothetical protein
MPRSADDGSKSIYISGVLLLDLKTQFWETRNWAPGGCLMCFDYSCTSTWVGGWRCCDIVLGDASTGDHSGGWG